MTVTSRLAAVATVATLLAGCSGDGTGGAVGADAPTTDPTTGSTGATASAEPGRTSTVEPANGTVVDNEVLTLRLPRGFEHEMDVFGGAAYLDEAWTRITVDAGDWSSDGSLAEAVRLVMETQHYDPRPRRRPDVEVDGQELAHFAGDRSRTGRWVEVFVTDRGGSLVVIEFTGEDHEVDREALYESVLATLEWR